ncbi:hypothetical protein [Klebsiella variicola]|uniref:hypothetical protein n=1 Tax=Klebsiella variicola TaxID=244366 RepID=UPI00388FFE6C
MGNNFFHQTVALQAQFLLRNLATLFVRTNSQVVTPVTISRIKKLSITPRRKVLLAAEFIAHLSENQHQKQTDDGTE